VAYVGEGGYWNATEWSLCWRNMDLAWKYQTAIYAKQCYPSFLYETVYLLCCWSETFTTTWHGSCLWRVHEVSSFILILSLSIDNVTDLIAGQHAQLDIVLPFLAVRPILELHRNDCSYQNFYHLTRLLKQSAQPSAFTIATVRRGQV